jgi:phospholipid/cholesterol/gamma-HCH transport system ATP-binding protein
MLWDEPTTGLDPETTRDISQLIKKMQEKYKVSSIVVTHDMICAKIVADRISVLNEGKYIITDTYENLEKSDDKFVRAFFNEEEEIEVKKENDIKN